MDYEAIVAKLRRTKDGVPVVPGEDVVYKWCPICKSVERCEVETCRPFDAEYDYVLLDEVWLCYSRPELVPGS